METGFPSEFTFAVPRSIDVEELSFLLLFGNGNSVCLGKIYSARNVTTFEQRISVYEAVSIELNRDALLRSVDYSTASRAFEQAPVLVEDGKSDLVKNSIIRRNDSKIDDAYFRFGRKAPEDSEVGTQAADAVSSALRIFGWKPSEIPPLREEQILDFDIDTIFGDRVARTPDGKHFFTHNGRKLYLHKTDRTNLEKYLGVDLIYNFLDQRRIVFIQYKCVASDSRAFVRSKDRNMQHQMMLMKSLPGIGECYNFSTKNLEELRLCRCPVFIKLCAREIKHGNRIPEGSYFPLCIWEQLYRDASNSIKLSEGTHINNQQFQELVKAGLIGSLPSQSLQIQDYLMSVSKDRRLRLIFEEGP